MSSVMIIRRYRTASQRDFRLTLHSNGGQVAPAVVLVNNFTPYELLRKILRTPNLVSSTC